MSNYSQAAWKAQQDRNDQLIADSKYMRPSVTSQVLPLQIDVSGTETLDAKQIATLQALEIEAARISIPRWRRWPPSANSTTSAAAST